MGRTTKGKMQMKANSGMFLVVFIVLVVFAGFALAQQKQPGDRGADPFTRMDGNGDGFLTPDELPQRLGGERFRRMDRNSDGKLSRAEFDAARPSRRPSRRREPLPNPDFCDVRYGPHERNKLDLWRAQTKQPAPLVMYIHGGGFRKGDKRSLAPDMLKSLLKAGVSVAAVNYRLTDVVPFPAQMHDCARAVQFLRLHASEYGIDPKRIGATGSSAGAGISQWLAFHEDLADPKAEDPLRRESTRLTCAAVFAAQTSYDPRFIRKLFKTTQDHEALISLFGMKSGEDVSNPQFHPLFEEASPINHVSADDAPVILIYRQSKKPLPPNTPGARHIHHPDFGFTLKKKMDALGVECHVRTPEDYSGGTFATRSTQDAVDFLLKHLTTPVEVQRKAQPVLEKSE